VHFEKTWYNATMKVINSKLAAVCLITFVAAVPAPAVEKYASRMFDVRDERRDVLDFFSNLPYRYNGHVTAVEQPAQDDARVRILATTEYVWNKDQPKYLWNNGHPTEYKERKVSKECVLRWTRRDQPLPFIVGMGVDVTAQDDGNVTAALVGETMLPYYRKRADGLIEVLLHYEVSDGKKVWLRARPDRIHLMDYVTVAWSRQHGLVISMFDAGGSETEEESPSVRTKGLPVSNVPGERIYIGRDGWKKTPPDPSVESTKRLTLPEQYIGAAG
jgi:hypothetical protein